MPKKKVGDEVFCFKKDWMEARKIFLWSIKKENAPSCPKRTILTNTLSYLSYARTIFVLRTHPYISLQFVNIRQKFTKPFFRTLIILHRKVE